VKCSILMAFNDSSSSRSALDFLIKINTNPSESRVTLLHVLRKPTGSEGLMGKKFVQSVPERITKAMESARRQLIDEGFDPEKITVTLVETPYPTVGDGIIDQFAKGDYNMVILGRKKMSKAEEFVMGDPSIRLVRALEGTAVLVVKA
jgi:nucleotide-binding universal stress UspA family protein